MPRLIEYKVVEAFVRNLPIQVKELTDKGWELQGPAVPIPWSPSWYAQTLVKPCDAPEPVQNS